MMLLFGGLGDDCWKLLSDCYVAFFLRLLCAYLRGPIGNSTPKDV